MVEIQVDGENIIICVQGWHVIWALKKRVEFKKGNIRSMQWAEPGLRPPWLRWPGTHIPGAISAGTYLGRGRREFWDTTFKQAPLEIILAHEAYTKVVVDVADPEKVEKLIEDVAGHNTNTK